MRTLFRPILILAAMMPLACDPGYTTPLGPGTLTPQEKNFQSVWRAGRDVLRDAGFEIDRQDRREGVITTYATPGQHFFELWRDDSPTFFHFRENTVQTILRAARVQVSRIPNTDRYRFDVEVRMARTTREPEQLTNSAQVRELHSGTAPGMRYGEASAGRPGKGDTYTLENPAQLKFSDLRIEESPSTDLVPLGRDGDLEAVLARHIYRRAPYAVYIGAESLGPQPEALPPIDLPAPGTNLPTPELEPVSPSEPNLAPVRRPEPAPQPAEQEPPAPRPLEDMLPD
jgi:hypothetical protein